MKRDQLEHVTRAAGVTAWCLEAHDLCVAKLCAGRSSDVTFCEALIRDGLVDGNTLRERLAVTDLPAARRELGDGLIRRAKIRHRDHNG